MPISPVPRRWVVALALKAIPVISSRVALGAVLAVPHGAEEAQRVAFWCIACEEALAWAALCVRRGGRGARLVRGEAEPRALRRVSVA